MNENSQIVLLNTYNQTTTPVGKTTITITFSEDLNDQIYQSIRSKVSS